MCEPRRGSPSDSSQDRVLPTLYSSQPSVSLTCALLCEKALLRRRQRSHCSPQLPFLHVVGLHLPCRAGGPGAPIVQFPRASDLCGELSGSLRNGTCRESAHARGQSLSPVLSPISFLTRALPESCVTVELLSNGIVCGPVTEDSAG